MLWRIFAYGSNLDRAQMARRCPSARVENLAWLSGWRLSFAGWSGKWAGGVATVVHRKHRLVPGVVYLVNDAELKALDGFEGCPTVYHRDVVTVKTLKGARVEAGIYVLNQGEKAAPGPGYLSLIVTAYKRLGFPLMELVEMVRNLPPARRPKPIITQYSWDRQSYDSNPWRYVNETPLPARAQEPRDADRERRFTTTQDELERWWERVDFARPVK